MGSPLSENAGRIGNAQDVRLAKKAAQKQEAEGWKASPAGRKYINPYVVRNYIKVFIIGRIGVNAHNERKFFEISHEITKRGGNHLFIKLYF